MPWIHFAAQLRKIIKEKKNSKTFINLKLPQDYKKNYPDILEKNVSRTVLQCICLLRDFPRNKPYKKKYQKTKN